MQNLHQSHSKRKTPAQMRDVQTWVWLPTWTTIHRTSRNRTNLRWAHKEINQHTRNRWGMGPDGGNNDGHWQIVSRSSPKTGKEEKVLHSCGLEASPQGKNRQKPWEGPQVYGDQSSNKWLITCQSKELKLGTWNLCLVMKNKKDNQIYVNKLMLTTFWKEP